MTRTKARITIVGGGYSGAATAVQLANAAGDALAVTIVEPRAGLGRGLAYSTPDPDHRLNGPLDNHLLDPAQLDELRQWCEREGLFARDPEARAPNGGIYIRRGDFGAYIDHAVRERSGVIRHHRATAIAMESLAQGPRVIASDGTRIASDAVVVATGNGPGELPAPLAALAADPRFIREALDAERLASIPRAARVLLVGGGLTAIDVISSLVRRGHEGSIVALSRHGVRPRPHRPRVPENSAVRVLERLDGPPPDYVDRALRGGAVRLLSRELRARIAETVAAGGDWQVPFDELRDAVWRFWPRLPLAEKRRFLRHMRIWYDAHRFRAPPQNDALTRRGERAGNVRFVTARLLDCHSRDDQSISATWAERESRRTSAFDFVVNCTGLDPACGARSNPFLLSLLNAGLARPDPTGVGFEVDAQCRPLGGDGTPSPRLRMVGPPTAGTFGDPLGVIFIAPQVARIVPGLLAEVGIMAP